MRRRRLPPEGLQPEAEIKPTTQVHAFDQELNPRPLGPRAHALTMEQNRSGPTSPFLHTPQREPRSPPWKRKKSSGGEGREPVPKLPPQADVRTGVSVSLVAQLRAGTQPPHSGLTHSHPEPSLSLGSTVSTCEPARQMVCASENSSQHQQAQ